MHARIRSMVCAAVAASVFYAGSSRAQEVLTEIVVTAQKREQNLQDVPVAVDAFSGAALQAAGAVQPVDLAAMTTVATITFGASTDVGASLEIEGLTIDSVTSNGAPILSASADTKQLDLGLPASDQQLAVVISYHWKDHEGFTGISSGGWTLDWPYYCGNVFPCHSQPSDGTTFSLDLQNVPDGKMAVDWGLHVLLIGDFTSLIASHGLLSGAA